MIKRIKKLWTEALRSGEYEQGKGELVLVSEGVNKPDQFCCLGVLTDLYVEETGDAEVWGLENHILHKRVAKWAGLGRRRNPKFQAPDGKRIDAVNMNDGDEYAAEGVIDGATFEEIADAIERYDRL